MTVFRWEAGKSRPRTEHLMKIYELGTENGIDLPLLGAKGSNLAKANPRTKVKLLRPFESQITPTKVERTYPGPHDRSSFLPGGASVLVVDDDKLVLQGVELLLEDDFRVTLASGGAEALGILSEESSIDVILLDIKMAKMDGFMLAREIRLSNRNIPIIFHTGYPGDYSEDEIDRDCQPFDYVQKGESVSRLVRAIRNAASLGQLKRRSSGLVDKYNRSYGLIGSSVVMRNIFEQIERVAPSSSKVMITGQTGVGKELIAKSIHRGSSRSENRLVIFNCSHKSSDMIESELFGHIRGSFTGAVQDRIGLFEYADGGTVFLDEIGNLDLRSQTKLLRAIETGEFQRVGSPEMVKADFRLLCATHLDLQAMVASGDFREDLYYRLKGIAIHVPPLTERREDIPELVAYFLNEAYTRHDAGTKLFDPDAMDVLIEYDWPGNVRHLADAVHSLAILTPSSIIGSEDVLAFLGLESTLQPTRATSFQSRVSEFKRTLLIQTLARCDHNYSSAARHLSLDPSNLRKIVKQLEVS